MGPTVGLLIVGVVLDLGFTRPRVEQVNMLCARRAALEERVSELSAQAWAADRINVHLGRDATADSLAAGDNDLAELARRIDVAGLRRLEIGVRGTEQQGHLTRARYTVRVTGAYQQILEFVRALEADRRLVVFESFHLRPIDGSRDVEGAFDLLLIDLEKAGKEGP
jgi:hypothetical protein